VQFINSISKDPNVVVILQTFDNQLHLLN